MLLICVLCFMYIFCVEDSVQDLYFMLIVEKQKPFNDWNEEEDFGAY